MVKLHLLTPPCIEMLTTENKFGHCFRNNNTKEKRKIILLSEMFFISQPKIYFIKEGLRNHKVEWFYSI